MKAVAETERHSALSCHQVFCLFVRFVCARSLCVCVCVCVLAAANNAMVTTVATHSERDDEAQSAWSLSVWFVICCGCLQGVPCRSDLGWGARLVEMQLCVFSAFARFL